MKVVRDNDEVINDECLSFIESEIALNPKKEAEKKAESRLQFKLKLRRLFFFLIACFVSTLLMLTGLNVWVCYIPLALHFMLLFYGFAVTFYDKRNKARAWNLYVAKYGKNGVIPPHVKMVHRKLIASGKKIRM